MLMRLLSLLGLLLLSRASLSQQLGTVTSDIPDSCPVTLSATKPFVPPWPYPARPYAGGHWFGSDGLWIDPPPNGEIRGLREKMSWWRAGYDWHTEPTPKLKVTGRRLDSQAPPLDVDGPNAVGTSGPPRNSIMVGLTFPTPGCWEITGHYESDELTFVVWVAK
jgi:hypothetical protein